MMEVLPKDILIDEYNSYYVVREILLKGSSYCNWEVPSDVALCNKICFYKNKTIYFFYEKDYNQIIRKASLKEINILNKLLIFQ